MLLAIAKARLKKCVNLVSLIKTVLCLRMCGTIGLFKLQIDDALLKTRYVHLSAKNICQLVFFSTSLNKRKYRYLKHFL